MMSQEVVGDGDGAGSMDGVNQPVLAVRQRAVVNPDMRPAEDRHPVAVRH